MPDPDETEDVENQDFAETFDEENITPDGRDNANLDAQRDVYDLTCVPEDADEALEPDDADLVAGDDLKPADLEADALADDDIEALGPGKDAKAPFRSDLEAWLDHALECTFPASDPFSAGPAD
jgi:hypothetical protein